MVCHVVTNGPFIPFQLKKNMHILKDFST